MTPFRPILSTTVVALLALGLQACDRSPTDDDSAPPQAAATAIDAAETAAAPLAATETTMAEAGVQPTAAGFDAKAFAGTYTAEGQTWGWHTTLALEGPNTLALRMYNVMPGEAPALAVETMLQRQ